MEKKKERRRRASERTLVLAVKNGFSYIAAWQFAGFTLLLLLVWANEVLDLASLLFGAAPTPPSIVRGCLASAGVLLAAVIVVGNTYLQQRSIISGMLTICSYCHKIRVDQEIWQRIEEYLSRNPMVLLSHGMCPECYEKVKQSWEEEKAHDRPSGERSTSP